MTQHELVIYEPKTGTVISLKEPVYLVDVSKVDPVIMVDLRYNTPGITDKEHLGHALHEYNFPRLIS